VFLCFKIDSSFSVKSLFFCSISSLCFFSLFELIDFADSISPFWLSIISSVSFFRSSSFCSKISISDFATWLAFSCFYIISFYLYLSSSRLDMVSSLYLIISSFCFFSFFIFRSAFCNSIMSAFVNFTYCYSF